MRQCVMRAGRGRAGYGAMTVLTRGTGVAFWTMAGGISRVCAYTIVRSCNPIRELTLEPDAQRA